MKYFIRSVREIVPVTVKAYKRGDYGYFMFRGLALIANWADIFDCLVRIVTLGFGSTNLYSNATISLMKWKAWYDFKKKK